MNNLNDMNYIVKTVSPEKNYTLVVGFIDGTKKRFDMKPVIAKGGVFEKLKDEEYFAKARVDRDTVAWDDVLDIAPETLYDYGTTVTA